MSRGLSPSITFNLSTHLSTKMASSKRLTKRSSNWVFTLNNPQEQLDLEGKCKYAVWQKEKGQSGTPHYQGYIEFKQVKSMRQVRAIIGNNPHVEVRKGTQEQAIKYCRKEEGRLEGPWDIGERKRPGKRTDLNKLGRQAYKYPVHVVRQKNPGMFLRYHAGIKAARALAIKDLRGNEWRKPEIHVFVGDAGTGKTRKAYEMDPNLYVVSHSSTTTWFDGYDGEETLLLDDFYGGIKYGFMLQLLDGHRLKVQVKGGFTYLNHKRVIITSNEDWTEWYKNVPNTHGLRRRIEEFGTVEHFWAPAPVLIPEE